MGSKVAGKPDFLAWELARRVSQEKKNRREAGVLTLNAPVLPDWWGGDPQFAGLVPRQDQEQDMQVLIAQWPNSANAGETDVLTFKWRPQGATSWENAQAPISVPGPLDPGDFPMALTLSKNAFQKEGAFELQYEVVIDVGSSDSSSITTFIIDKTPPNNNQSPTALTFNDPTVISDGITSDYLAANGGVAVTIPPYNDKKVGDSLEIYVHNENTVPTEPVYSADVGTPQTVKVPTTAFEGLRDGKIYLYYRLVDKVGNRGPISDNAETGLFIQPLPVPPLAAPLVPRIVDDKVLNLDDVLEGEDLVKVALYGNWLEHDLVELTWGTASVHAVHEVLSAENPMTLIVPYPTILAPAYGAAKGPLATDISYVVRRGNKTFPSAKTTIDVDFFVPGPVNPDRPRPVNPNLPRVTVRGTGSTPTDNVLNDDDAGLPVEVTVNLYSPIGTGERMILYWYSQENQVGTFSPVAGTPGSPYTFTVPWDDIKDLPSGTEVPVHYTVGLISGAGNLEACIPTLVDVSAALPIKLAEPEFPDAGQASDGSPALNCASYIGADQHVVIDVPPNPLLKGGEELTFTWQCYTDKVGTVPAGTAQTFTKDVSAADASNGFSVQTGKFTDYIVPVGRNGSVRLTYVSDTTPVMQGSAFIRAGAQNAGGVCPPNARRRI
ncbi:MULTISPECIES: hypothetical protein [unclassified Pseudomonas]|uniref:hypothetical protein n=1 Tax=unclassified Pseudomonas TaxID=196821 RepID=UPI000D396D84|nr:MULTISPECIES: hypothetical protein [unclassified Pseudomonas]RAU49286.1 hypothetical protein DBP26_000265 [Pseudomonas sp. RIT 409]RAU55973.1 hypothetical protein DBY65_002250 [Pseudomonas sp. RIT 412]